MSPTPVNGQLVAAQGFDESDLDQLIGNIPVTGIDLNGFVSDQLATDFDSVSPFQCFTHPDQNDCACQDFGDQWALPDASNQDQFLALDEPDYSKFENWIPRFVRPEKPCDYCRSRRLQCYTQQGEASCTACNSLFRECSLTNSHTLEAINYLDGSNGTFLDTLHIVDENAVKDQGTFTGIKPLNSKGRASGTSTPVRSLDDAPGSTKRNSLRFPRHAIKTLRTWFDSHSCHPYPTEEEKAELEKQTELKPIQIVNWLANERRRRKASDRPPRVMESPSLKPVTPAIMIPQANKPWDELNPLERWKHSPPENEPALMTDIVHAVVSGDLPQDQLSLSTSSKSSRRRQRSSNGSMFSAKRAASTTSADTSKRSSSNTVSSAAYSHGSSNSFGSFGSFGSGLAGKKDRHRRKRPTSTVVRKLSDDSKKRTFQCTFCTDTFKSKYDWTRHEKSLHLSLEKWICAPLGPAVVDPNTGKTVCVYCNAQEPTQAHLETHHHRQCEEKGLEARTFYRKDHLRQHMRLMHGCELMPHMDAWKAVIGNINSRCGFCAQRFSVWQERVDHLTAHFKAGARMSEWKGCRGLDPSIAAQVTNAMPPYLIGIEAVSPMPFSATNRATWRQIPSEGVPERSGNTPGASMAGNGHCGDSTVGGGERTTCWEVLTVKLAQYATEQANLGNIMTDEMLQQQARRILYDSDDSWNQTPADHPEWLDLFKKAHGLDMIPTSVGGQGIHVPEDLEIYGDLGLRIPFAVQLAAYNQKNAADPGQTALCLVSHVESVLEAPRMRLKATYTELAAQGLLHDEELHCGHMECAANIIDLTCLDGRAFPGPRNRRWCSVGISEHNAALFDELQESILEASQFSVPSASQVGAHGDVRPDTSDTLDLSSLRPPKQQQLATETSAPTRSYLPRHQHELPYDRARWYATLTGAWKDSGEMPEARSTADMFHQPPSETNSGTNSGVNSTAMMNMTPEMIIDKDVEEILASEPSLAAPLTANVDQEFALFTNWPSQTGPLSPGGLQEMVDLDFNEITFEDDVFAMQLDANLVADHLV